MAVEEEEAQTEVVTAVGSGILERGDKSWDADRSAVLSLRTLVKGQSFSEMLKSYAVEQWGDSQGSSDKNCRTLPGNYTSIIVK